MKTKTFQFKSFLSFALVLAFGQICQQSAVANDDVPKQGSNAQQIVAPVPNWAQNISASYFGIMNGSSLNFQPYTPDPKGQNAGAVGSWNILGLNYKTNSSLSFDAQAIFNWDTLGVYKGSLLNPRFGVAGQVIKNERISLWANFNVEPSFTNASRLAQRMLNFGGFYEFFYSLQALPQLKVGMFHWARLSLYSGKGDGSGNYLDAAITPIMRHQISDSFAPQLGVVVNYSMGRNNPKIKLDVIQIQPGFNWVINSKASIMPYLILQPQERISMANSSFGFWLSYTLI